MTINYHFLFGFLWASSFFVLMNYLEKELNQQRFNNKNNLSIDQKISDQIESMKNPINCLHGTIDFICLKKDLRNPRCDGCIEWRLKK